MGGLVSIRVPGAGWRMGFRELGPSGYLVATPQYCDT
jgi:hypothetical protein